MATTFHLTISTESSRQTAAECVLEECHREIARFESELSEYRDSSPVYLLNQAGPYQSVQLSEDGMALLQLADTIRLETDNAFHFGAKGALEPNPPFRWDAATGRIQKLTDRAWLGFGAIGKGFALDRVRTIIEQNGFEHFCLNAGGSSIILSGQSAPAEPWKWAWSWTRAESGLALGLEFAHENSRSIAIGVSGTQEQGQHLVRQQTDSTPLTTTLVASESAAVADALSTALYSAGWERFFDLPKLQHRDLKVAAIDSKGVPRWNGLFQQVWGPLSTFFFWISFHSWFLGSSFADDEVVDLGDAVQAVNPYLLERDPTWALLPLAALALVLLHLKQPPRMTINAINPSKMEKENETDRP